MKIAQVVITKTKDDGWKVAAMSLKATEDVDDFDTAEEVISLLMDLLTEHEWEQLSL